MAEKFVYRLSDPGNANDSDKFGEVRFDCENPAVTFRTDILGDQAKLTSIPHLDVTLQEFATIRYGIEQARRAGLEKRSF